MTVLSDYLEDDALSYYFTTDSVGTRPTAWYMSLHDGDPGDTGADELTTGEDSGYARVSGVTFSKLANNSVTNDANITYNATDGTNIITHIGIWDAASSGNLLVAGALDGPRTITSTAPLTIAAGDLIIAID